MVPQIKLSEFFGLFPPKYVLGTTYTLSLAFFESVVWPHIKRKNLHRCIRPGTKKYTVGIKPLSGSNPMAAMPASACVPAKCLSDGGSGLYPGRSGAVPTSYCTMEIETGSLCTGFQSGWMPQKATRFSCILA